MPLHLSRCYQCGQTDDHPKVVLGSPGDPAGLPAEDVRYHHDCLPAGLREHIANDTEHGAAIIDAATSGTHGAELRAHIADLHATTETKES